MSFNINLNTSKMQIHEMDLLEGDLPMEDLEVTIIEQMRNTQLDVIQNDQHTIFDEYDMGPMQDDFGMDYEDSNPMSQDLIGAESIESSAAKEIQNDDKQNYSNIFEKNFEFWNYMEPENWHTSLLIRKRTHHQASWKSWQQEEDEDSRIRRDSTPINKGTRIQRLG